MLTDDEIDAIAQEHVRTSCPPEYVILHRKVHSDPDGIYFHANRRGGLFEQDLGPGGFFVLRSSGELFQFGSGQLAYEGLAYWVKYYSDLSAEGLQPGMYRLTVLEVKSVVEFARLLQKHGVGYEHREVAHGIVWSQQVTASLEEILERLATLPCTFIVWVDVVRTILLLIRKDEIARVEYSYVDHRRRPDWRPENNPPDKLGRQWD